jgi:hypothetical protein
MSRRRVRRVWVLGVVVVLAGSVWTPVSSTAASTSAGTPAADVLTPSATIPAQNPVCFPHLPGHPVVTDVTVDVTSVDVTRATKTLTFTVRAHESEAPVEAIDEVQIGLGAPVYKDNYRDASGTATTPSTGTSTDGTWQVKVVIPRYTNPGTWTIGGVYVHDVGRGWVEYSTDNYIPTMGPTPQPWGSTWPRTINVTSTPDIRAPHPLGFSARPLVVDTRTSTRTIAVKASVADSQSGVAGVTVWIGPPRYSYGRYDVSLKRISGTARKGTWTGRITVPRWIGSGVRTWTFTAGYADPLDNFETLSHADLAKRHLTSTFRVRSNGDKVDPVLRSFAYTRSPVDSRSGQQPVPVTMRLTDDYSGVATASLIFVSPHGVRSRGGELHRVTGDRHDGIWTGSTSIPRCSESGTWHAQVRFRDAAGNLVLAPGAKLAAPFPATLKVTALDTIGPQVVDYPKATAHAVTVTFDEPVLFAKPIEQVLIVDSYPEGDTAGTWTCRNRSGAVQVCDAEGADVLTATFVPKHAFQVGADDGLGQRMPDYEPSGIYDLMGNPSAPINSSFNIS